MNYHDPSQLLDECIYRAEMALADMRLGVTAYVSFDEARALHFKKHDKQRWRLVIERAVPACEAAEFVLLTECCLEDRSRALELLPELRIAMIAEAEQLAVHIIRAVERAEAFLATISRA